MQKDLEPALCTWDVPVPNTPQRSQLYSLAPIGCGSSFVESLTSYICRLAQEHHLQVGALIRHIVAPCIPKGYIDANQSRSISSFLRYATPINGNGVMASDWTKVLITLTSRHDISQLTLLACTNALSQRNLLQSAKQWCPICYDEWRHEGSDIYDPLIWLINEIKVCTKHNVVLEKCCPHCSSYPQWLSWRARPGYCSTCENWLGRDKSKSQAKEKDIYIAETMENFVAYASQLSSPIPTADFIQSLQNLVSNTTQGNMAAFSRQTGLSKTTLWELTHGVFPPSLPLLSQLCWQYRLSLHQLLIGSEVTTCEIPSADEPVTKKRARRSLERKKVQRQLENILADSHSESLSMRKVAQQLGYHTRTIATYFPEYSRRISQRYINYCKRQGEYRKARLKQRIREAAYTAHEQGFNLTTQRVGAILDNPGCFREREAREALFNVQQEIYSLDMVSTHKAKH
ncbi:TniQ family protein [Ktedonobacter sp. SOSP1-52]|uniref:TniQ family protein n=1 Tax=Ktedonobacter sp. SOSP1-52 TaxID=2778366 RepID=UPI0019153D82|nr:TniQ family protein [Ktedonobacter sp. SOSP1-52]